MLSFEYDTTQLSELAGFRNLKQWLAQRRGLFGPTGRAGLEPPKGILLLGVQGCGKSLAAKATAGAFGVPLLRLDFGSLYNKYHGETERNLRESLQTAEVLSPCVLWLDEIEKGLATGNDDSGTARRVLGGLLTWMAERRAQVFSSRRPTRSASCRRSSSARADSTKFSSSTCRRRRAARKF